MGYVIIFIYINYKMLSDSEIMFIDNAMKLPIKEPVREEGVVEGDDSDIPDGEVSQYEGPFVYNIG